MENQIVSEDSDGTGENNDNTTNVVFVVFVTPCRVAVPARCASLPTHIDRRERST